VLQLSRREPPSRSACSMLGDWLEDFVREFCETMQCRARENRG
jgi:hypothetical protein